MTQQKAASLTSSLFARKGKASPARQLISEMTAAGGESLETAVRHVPADSGGPDSSRAGAGKARANGLNGAARRKAKVEASLPLLAYVEAQEAPDWSLEQVDDAVATVEPAPAASLLERGPRSLRRSGSRPAAEVPGAEAPAAEAVMSPPAAAEADVAAEVIEAEIVSGDADVAAIEDAPHDEDVPAEPEAVAEAPVAAAESSDAIEKADTVEAADTAPTAPASAEPEAPPAARQHAPSVQSPPPAMPTMPATLALRQAAALATPAPATARPETSPAAPVRHSAIAWRSAAVVALGAALGLGFYLVLAGEPAPPPVASSAPESAPLAPAVAVAPQAEADATPAPAPAVAATTAPVAAPAISDLAEATTLPEPSFDIIRIEPNGQSIIAGRAAPGSEWILLNNGEPIASVQADANGEWVVLPDGALVPGANAFGLVPKAERGRVAIPAPAAATPEAPPPAQPRSEPPARPRSENETAAPRADAGDPLPALPTPKPLQAAAAQAASTTFRAATDGAYEVQLASVRQTADAERERRRLAAAFPRLLGAMDLRVQEATLEGSGVFYRVRSGAIGELGLARELCRQLEAEGQGCLVVRRPEALPSSAVADDVPDAATAVRQQAAERPR